MNWSYEQVVTYVDDWPVSVPMVDGLSGRDGQILRATLECIVEKGIAHTSTHAVAERAGMSQGFIHYYFQSKENLLVRLAEELVAWVTSAIGEIAAAEMSGIDKIRTVVKLWRPVESNNSEFLAIVALWAHANAVRGPILDVMRSLFSFYRTAYKSIAEQGHAEGSLTDEAAAVLPGILVAMPWGLGLQTTIEPGCIEWDPLVESALSALTITPLGVDEEDHR
jgi:AcrR family transcriptional regulator